MNPARTPEPPYWAVIFTSTLNPEPHGYEEMAVAMVELAARQPGFLGFESARGADGLGVTVSYWASLEAVAAWKEVAAHQAAQRTGIERWYRAFVTRVARVERTTTFPPLARS